MPNMPSVLECGIDVLLADANSLLRNKRIGLVTNDVALTKHNIPIRLALQQQGFQIVKLFSPEHGIAAKGEDGAFQQHGIDEVTALPIVSLYSEKLMPNETDLLDVDAVVYDIPDVGCRFYTYLWTLTYVMEACMQFGKLLVVLDRPNPIGGDLSKAEGPMLDETHCSSFIGRWRLPIRHSCTTGELAMYFAALKLPALALEVIKCKGCNRRLTMEEANRPFVPTSPAIRTLETAMLYPGTCFWEGINVNEGRGTPFPFVQMGAPWINAVALCVALRSKNIAGIHFEPARFIPLSNRYAALECEGIRCSISDNNSFRPVHSGIVLLQTLATLYPEQIAEATYPTRANPSGGGHLDRLLGLPNSFEKIIKMDPLDTAVPLWKEEIAPYLLYPA
ncbi:MAG: exo-beta-N-acetylmuramidase NamZ family protein [Chitinophagaceae bacterium]